MRIQSHSVTHGLDTDVRFIAIPSVPSLHVGQRAENTAEFVIHWYGSIGT